MSLITTANLRNYPSPAKQGQTHKACSTEIINFNIWTLFAMFVQFLFEACTHGIDMSCHQPARTTKTDAGKSAGKLTNLSTLYSGNPFSCCRDCRLVTCKETGGRTTDNSSCPRAIQSNPMISGLFELKSLMSLLAGYKVRTPYTLV